MIVTIWRHAEAGRAATDRQRELTDQGFDDIGFACSQLHKTLEARGVVQPELILHSPWVRTRETAEIIASAFTHASKREASALQPGSNIAKVEDLLAALAAALPRPCHVVLVSHQPLVSQLVDHYLGVASGVPPLCPGALVTFTLEVVARHCGELQFWAAPPEYEAGL